LTSKAIFEPTTHKGEAVIFIRFDYDAALIARVKKLVGYKDENGQVHSQTEWHNIVLWRGLAELAEKYLKKGSMVHVEGKNRTRSYEDKQGLKRYVTEVVGEEIIMLDKKEG